MKTCPACHRPVPDTATRCPHQGCGHALPAAHIGVKRPPPPPTRVQVAGKDFHSAMPQTAAKQSSSGAPKPWRRPLVLLAAILLTSVLTAALTAFLLRGGQRQEVASAKATASQAEPKAASKAGKPAAQQPPKKPVAVPVDESSKPPQPPAAKKDAAAEDDGAAQLDGASPPKADAPPNKPDDDDAQQPLGIAGEDRKPPMPGPPLGLMPEPMPEPLAVPDEPKLPIVEDTPQALYAARTQPKTAEWLAERGGTLESQKAVEDGLNWLARHQGIDGHWGADCLGSGLHSRCNRKGPCRGPGWTFDVAHTGLALLAFQAAGHYDFNRQKYSGQVQKGLDYLLRKQSVSRDGCFVDPLAPTSDEKANMTVADRNFAFMYEHAIATFALCEACAVAIAEGKTPSSGYQRAAQRAVSYIENIQHDDGGWRYRPDRNEMSDSSVSGWVMLALKTAREAKLKVSPQTISRMMDFFAAHYRDGGTEYFVVGDDPVQVIPPGVIAQFSPNDRPSTLAMTAVGMMAVEFFEHKLDSPIVQAGAATLADQAQAVVWWGPKPVGPALGALGRPFPDLNGMFAPTNNDYMPNVKNYGYYLWYNCTMAMFQVGGEPWKRWNDAVRDNLIRLQIGDVTELEEKGLRVIGGPPGANGIVSCERGSWRPEGDAFGSWGGRVYTTALAVLTLEVYYRFQRVAGQPEKGKFFEK